MMTEPSGCVYFTGSGLAGTANAVDAPHNVIRNAADKDLRICIMLG